MINAVIIAESPFASFVIKSPKSLKSNILDHFSLDLHAAKGLSYIKALGGNEST